MPKVPALVLTPAARDAAIAALQEHYAKNHLELADLELRLKKAEDARTTAELDDALAGLPALAGDLARRERAGQRTTTVRAVLATTTHQGRWRVPSRVVVRALFGTVVLDLSEAELGGEVDIDVAATLGTVRIVVPEGLCVRTEGRALLGSFAHLDTLAASERDPRRVRIVGRALLGSVEIVVKPRKPSLLASVRGLLTGER
jgi:hypothetical protein